MLEKSGFSKITHIIVTMYFTTFEGLIVYRNTRRPCYVSKRAYSCRVREFSEPLHFLRLNGRVGTIPTYIHIHVNKKFRKFERKYRDWIKRKGDKIGTQTCYDIST